MLHTIGPVRETLHGHFSRDLPPVLTIEPGDTVRFSTLPGGWNLEPRRSTRYEDQPRTFAPRDPVLDDGHALCGPIAIRGALPGMALAVRIDALRVGAWGTTSSGGWASEVNDRLGVAAEPGTYLLWTLDAERLIGEDQHGHCLPLGPFMGVMGVAPGESGIHSTVPPRPTGGNIDCKELVVGSTLYLPIAVPGALFSTGDGHALQADGEASTTAIECPIERVDLTFSLRPDLHLALPRAETPIGWLTFGFHEDLDEAMFQALEGMLDLMGELHGLERREALALASLVVDLRITQVVNGAKGVHAVLPHGVLAKGKGQ